MALSYSQAYVVMQSQSLLNQVEVAILAYAATVLAESTGTSDDTNRRNLAWAVMKNPATYAQRFVNSLIPANLATLTMDSTGMNTSVPDGTVLGAVTAVWSNVADSLASPVQ